MKKNIIFAALFMLLFTFSACKKSKFDDLTIISYGSSFGMCVGYCTNELTISDLKITYSKIQRSPKPDTKECTKPITVDEVEAIKNLLNSEKIAALPEVIGCPDCADGGAEWVAINADGKNYKITFEYGKPPKELEAAVAKLKLLKESFNDCK
jgi:hypothetical protein